MDDYITVTLYDEITGEYYTIKVENEDRACEIKNEYYNN